MIQVPLALSLLSAGMLASLCACPSRNIPTVFSPLVTAPAFHLR